LVHSRFVRSAHERGLGCGDVRSIEVVGDADLMNETWQFDVIGDDDSNGYHCFGACSSIRQWVQYYHWPARDRRVFESWLRHTGWGQLFQQYQRPTDLRF